MAVRTPIPIYPYGMEENHILYDRFHALKHKSSRKRVTFTWNSFQEFLESVVRRAPQGYIPSQYRMAFDLDEKNPTYSEETMQFYPGRALQREFRSPRPARSTLHDKATQGVYSWKLAAELAILLLTEAGDIDTLAGTARANLESEDNEQDPDDDPENCRAEECLA